MGIPILDLMNYSLGLASIATTPAQQAVLLAQRLAGLGIEPEPGPEPASSEVAPQLAPPAAATREAA